MKHNFIGRLLIFLSAGLSSVIYLIVHCVLKYRYGVIRENFQRSFPYKDSHQIKQLVRDYYRHLADLVVEPFLFYCIGNQGRKKLANFSNIDFLHSFYEQKSSVVALASHYGNWEYMINIASISDYRSFTAYSPLSSKFLNELLLKLRSWSGVNLIPKKYFYRAALSALKGSDNPALVVVIADQRPAPGSAKYSVDFLGMNTLVQIGAERLAVASKAVVLFLACRKTSRFHYEYTFHYLSESVDFNPMEITKSYYRMLEASIQESPSEWLWSHKRWKTIGK